MAPPNHYYHLPFQLFCNSSSLTIANNCQVTPPPPAFVCFTIEPASPQYHPGNHNLKRPSKVHKIYCIYRDEELILLHESMSRHHSSRPMNDVRDCPITHNSGPYSLSSEFTPLQLSRGTISYHTRSMVCTTPKNT